MNEQRIITLDCSSASIEELGYRIRTYRRRLAVSNESIDIRIAGAISHSYDSATLGCLYNLMSLGSNPKVQINQAGGIDIIYS
jgi:hypothetical protein